MGTSTTKRSNAARRRASLARAIVRTHPRHRIGHAKKAVADARAGLADAIADQRAHLKDLQQLDGLYKKAEIRLDAALRRLGELDASPSASGDGSVSRPSSRTVQTLPVDILDDLDVPLLD